MSHWPEASGCECTAACGLHQSVENADTSWLHIIKLIAVWQLGLWYRYVINIQSILQTWFTDILYLLFFLNRYDICTYKNKPCGTLGKIIKRNFGLYLLFPYFILSYWFIDWSVLLKFVLSKFCSFINLKNKRYSRWILALIHGWKFELCQLVLCISSLTA